MPLEADNLKIEVSVGGVEFGDTVLSELGDKAVKISEIFEQNISSKGITSNSYLNYDLKKL